MARACSVCSHPEGFEVNTRLIVDRESNRRVAAQFGLSEQAIRRHRQHIPEQLVQASEAQAVADADTLLDDIVRIRESAFDLLDQAERAHEWRARVAAIRECRENVRILGELHGRLEASRKNISINVLASAEWITLKGQIVGALRPHPQALESVLRAITAGETNGQHE
jgi:hypothetical protein